MNQVFKIILVLVAVLALTVIAAGFFMGSIVKKGVETFGPKVAKVEMKLDSANISIFSGKGTLKGVFVGNPAGFSSPSAIKAGKISVAVKPGSFFSDKIVIESVRVIAPEITLHGLKGDNLQKILGNIQASTGGGTGGAAINKTGQTSTKKIQVDDLLIKDGKVNFVLPMGTMTVALPEIHLTNLGKETDGLMPGELFSKVLKAVLNKAISVAGNAKNLSGVTEGAGKEVGKLSEKVTKGIGSLFK
jgi:hypothetical protein